MKMLSGEQIAKKVQAVPNFGQKIWNEIYFILTLRHDWYYPELVITPFDKKNCDQTWYNVTLAPNVKLSLDGKGGEEYRIPETGTLAVPPGCRVICETLQHFESSKYSVTFVPKKETHGFKILVKLPDVAGKKNQKLELCNNTKAVQHICRNMIVGEIWFYKTRQKG